MNTVKQKIRQKSNQNSLLLLIYFLFIFICSIIFSVILFIFQEIEIFSELRNHEWLVSGLVQYLVALPFSVSAVKSTKNGKNIPELKEVFRKPQASRKDIARWIMISLFLIYAMSYVSNAIFTVIQTLTGIELHAVDFSADDTPMGIFTNILLIMFLAPLFEEILFRGIMVQNSGKYSTWSSIIALGIMFGLFHMNYEQTLYTSVLGICAGFLLIKTKSILPSILLHFCMNTVGAVQSILVRDMDTEKLASGNQEYIQENILQLIPFLLTELLILIVMITGLVFFILELTNHKDTFNLENEFPELSESKKLGIYFTAPLTIVITVLFSAVTVINAISDKNI